MASDGRPLIEVVGEGVGGGGEEVSGGKETVSTKPVVSSSTSEVPRSSVLMEMDDGEAVGGGSGGGGSGGGGTVGEVGIEVVGEEDGEGEEGKKLEIEEVEGEDGGEGGDGVEGGEDRLGYAVKVLEWKSGALSSMDARDAWHCWNLDESVQFVRFSVGQKLHLGSEEEVKSFLCDLFNGAEVRGSFVPVTKRKTPIALSGTVDEVRMRELSVTQTSMSFFDKFVEEGLVVGESGYIKKKMDEVVDGATFQDHFRDVLGNPDAEYSYLYDDDERDELLFVLMRTLAVGGSMCQWDDKWDRYLSICRDLYKDLVKVRKNPHTGALEIQSRAWTIEKLASSTAGKMHLFPTPSIHNQCLVILDPSSRTGTILYAPFVPFW